MTAPTSARRRARGAGATVMQVLRARPEVVALAGIVLGTLALPGDVPLGIYGLGVAGGATIALHAIGLVLVYRSNRIINFAQVQMGAIAGLLFAIMVVRREPLVLLHHVCPTCVPAPPVGTPVPLVPGTEADEVTDAQAAAMSYDGWLLDASFWLSLVLVMTVVAGLSWAAYHLVIKRFATAPRLVATIVTVALGQVFLLLRASAPGLFGAGDFNGKVEPPIDVSFEISPALFGTVDVARTGIALLAVVGLAVFLRRSLAGVALRGAADDPERMQTLGVDTGALTSRVWVVAGLLSATVSVLDAMAIGASGDLSGAVSIVRVLAAGVIAAMTSLPVAVVAAIAIGVLDQAVLWSLDSALVTEGLLFIVILAVLLLQRRRRTRSDTGSEGAWTAARELRPIPAELKQVESVRTWTRAGAGGLALILLLAPWVLSPSQTNLMTTTVVVAMIGLSLLVLTGWAGQISLGQLGLAAVGAWVAAASGVPFILGLPLGAVAGAVAAMAVGLPALRLRGLNLAVTTLAFAGAVVAFLLNPRYLAAHLPDSLERPVLLGLDLGDERTYFYVAVVVLLVTIGAVAGLRRGRTARTLIAARDNEAAVQSYGVDLLRLRLSAFAASGAIAGAGGVLLAYAQFGVNASAFSVEQNIAMFLIAVLGGLNAIAGPLLGAAFYGLVVLASDSELVRFAASGLGTLVLLSFLPGGLTQAYGATRDAALRRVADRRRIHVPSLIADDGRRRTDDRAPIEPKLRPGGTPAVVARRYRLDGQWLTDRPAPEPEDEPVLVGMREQGNE